MNDVSFVAIKMAAEAVADAAHLVYWMGAEGGAYHRADLLTQADKLAGLIEALRAQPAEVAA